VTGARDEVPVPDRVTADDDAARDEGAVLVLGFVLVLETTREDGPVRGALLPDEGPMLADVPVPERLETVGAPVLLDVELWRAVDRVGVERFLSSSLLVLPDDLYNKQTALCTSMCNRL